MLWQRRHFIIGYATARNVSMYTEAKLGQLWQVLTPLLNAGVYYLIFGVLFEASRGVQHYPAFLLAGVFVFAFTERSIVTGSNVMRANLQLIRALYFPRASLPLAYVIVELQQMLVGMVVLIPVMLVSGEPLTVYWFLLIPVVLLQTAFNIGAALIVARLGGSLADVSELIPFILRITRYFCGVMYMVTTLPAAVPDWGIKLLSLNPPAVYISLVRVALMKTYRQNSPGNQPYNAAYCAAFQDQRHRRLAAWCSGGKYVPLPSRHQGGGRLHGGRPPPGGAERGAAGLLPRRDHQQRPLDRRGRLGHRLLRPRHHLLLASRIQIRPRLTPAQRVRATASCPISPSSPTVPHPISAEDLAAHSGQIPSTNRKRAFPGFVYHH